MNTLDVVFYGSILLWFCSEIYYKQKLKSRENDQKKDNSTLNILWVVIIPSVFCAVFVSEKLQIAISDHIWIKYLGLFFILSGTVFRFIIIRSLGKFFTVDVSIKEDHQIKKEGFYKYLRHPSYAFSLLSFFGLGLFLNNWISLALAFIPVFLAFRYRIKIEEKALIERFGDEYREYIRATKKLIPFIY